MRSSPSGELGAVLPSHPKRCGAGRAPYSLLPPSQAPCQGFHRGLGRRERGWGRFLTEADIERVVATNVIEVVLSVPGINYIPPHGPNTVGRVGSIVFSRGRCARPAVYLDGLIFRAEDLLSVSTANVAAVELYNGPSEVPVEFNRTGSACGVIVIWTK